MPSSKTYLYNGPADWGMFRGVWQFYAETAEGENIWKFILNGNWPEEPTAPQPPQAEPPARATRSSAVSSTAGPSATPPTGAYADDLLDYKLDLEKYHFILDAKAAVISWLHNSIDPVTKKTHCGTGDLHDWYKNLEETYKRDGVKMVQEIYKSVFDYDLKNGRNFVVWIDQWCLAIAKAKRAGIPETLEAEVWIVKFLKKICPIMPDYAIMYQDRRREQIKENTLEYDEVASDVKSAWERRRWFHAATYGSSDVSNNKDDQQEERPRKRVKQEKKTPQKGGRGRRGRGRGRKFMSRTSHTAGPSGQRKRASSS